MLEREKNILDAATRLFARYGVKRTSMSDVAEEAGVSRQTLYKSYSNKNEILVAHIRAYTDEAVEEIEAALPGVDGLAGQLDLIFDKMTVVGFDLVRASPNAEDITEGVNQVAKDELEAASKRYQKIIKRVLVPYEDALEQSGISPEPLADFIQRSARAAKNYAQDRKHLLKQLDTLKKLCLSAAGVSE